MATVEMMALGLAVGGVLFLIKFIITNKAMKGIMLVMLGVGITGAEAMFNTDVQLMLIPLITITIAAGLFYIIQALTGRGGVEP